MYRLVPTILWTIDSWCCGDTVVSGTVAARPIPELVVAVVVVVRDCEILNDVIFGSGKINSSSCVVEDMK